MTDTTITSATTQNVAITNLVTLNNDTPVTTSLKIAEVFGKSHKHVIRAIENAIKTINGLNLEDSKQMASEQAEPKIGPSYFDTTTMFKKSTYIGRDGAKAKMYYLNRDAFVFTVMGFTGKEAAAWKLRYIHEFNRMENYIRSQQGQTPQMSQTEIVAFLAAKQVENEQRLDALERSVQLNFDTCKEAVTVVSNYVQNLSNNFGLVAKTVQELSSRLENTPDEYLPINKAAANALNKSVRRLAFMYSDRFGITLPSAVYNIQEGIRILLTGRYKIDIDEELDKLQAWLRFDYNRRIKSKTKTRETLTPSEISKLSIYAVISTRNAWTHTAQTHVDFKIQHFEELAKLKK